MMSQKIKVKIFLLTIFVSLTTYSYSQDFFTKELNWNYNDTISMPIFQDTSQIVEWAERNFGSIGFVESEKFHACNRDVFLLMVDICSGLCCPNIYVFEEKNNQWKLIVSTFARLQDQIKIEFDNIENRIIFKVNSSQIGEFSIKD